MKPRSYFCIAGWQRFGLSTCCTKSSVFTSSRRARSDGQPPANAQVCYKAVATAPDGRMYAIFDGQTEYKLQTTTHAPTGLWVCPSIFAACVHARRLPSFSAALDWPRVMLRCLAWEERDGETWPLPPPRPGAQKLRATHVVPLAVLPYSALSDYGRPSGSACVVSSTVVSCARRRSTAMSCAT